MASRRRRSQADLQLPGPEQGAIGLFIDAMIRHQVGLLRFSGRVARRVRELLDDTEKDLRSQVRRRLRGSRGARTPAAVKRMERLIAELAQIRGRAWDQVENVWIEEMRELVVAEPRFVDGILKTTVPVSLETILPDPRRLRALVRTLPFEGANLRQHMRRIRSADLRRIESQVRIGLVQNETPPEIARRLVGTVRLRGRNGVTEVTRRHAINLARTATSAFANAATREWTLSNADILQSDLFVATLDSRTTPICRALDGEQFPIDQVFPQLPLHFGERSRRIPIVDPEPLGKRPMKPVTERMLLREFSRQEGFQAPRRRADLPFGTKGAFDEFARRRTRELIGRVPAKTTYAEFLRRQSVEFQEDVMGVTKARLFRRGKLDLKAFVDETGAEKSLAELSRDETAAFRAAGLDPTEFLP